MDTVSALETARGVKNQAMGLARDVQHQSDEQRRNVAESAGSWLVEAGTRLVDRDESPSRVARVGDSVRRHPWVVVVSSVAVVVVVGGIARAAMRRRHQEDVVDVRSADTSTVDEAEESVDSDTGPALYL